MDMILEFKASIPEVEQLATKLKYRKEADPFLEQMVKDLSEAIKSEKLHLNLQKAKMDYLDETEKHVDHISRQPSSMEKA